MGRIGYSGQGDVAAVNRVLMIAYHFPPIRGSSGLHRTLQFARYLPEHGWEGLVVSVSPRAYPMVASDLLDDVPSTLIVRRAFALDSARHFSFRGRYFGFTAFPDRWVSWWPAGVLACLKLIRHYRPAAIWSTYPVATAHLIGLTIRKITGLPWVADFRDPMVHNLRHPQFFGKAIWEGLEKAIVRNADRCVFVTKGMMLDYAARFTETAPASWSVIENGYDEELFNKAERDACQCPCQHKNGVRLLHSGILYGEGRNPAFFFEALKQVVGKRRDLVEVALRGSGDVGVYQRMAADFGLAGVVKVLQPNGYREAIAEMLHADGLILIQGSMFNKQIPAKAYEYLRSGRPILALMDGSGDTAGLLKRWDGIYPAHPESVAQISEALFNLLDYIALRRVPIRPKNEVLSMSRLHRTSELASVLNGITCAAM